MSFREQAVTFSCAGDEMFGIIALPAQSEKTGVLIMVGGPQYRVGSHRQFLLLSRGLAIAGFPAMRFDYRGMGDSKGASRNFECVSEDIGAAVDVFMSACPSLERIVLWGLCDAASAALLYCDETRDQRIGGLILLNPWVRSEATLARAHIKHYYAQRLLQPEFWRKLLHGQLGVRAAIGGFLKSLRQAQQAGSNMDSQAQLSFQQRMLRGLKAFRGATLVILSGNDYTAKEFIESTNASPAWQAALTGRNVVVREVSDADHTFSTGKWSAVVEALTIGWLRGETGASEPEKNNVQGGDRPGRGGGGRDDPAA